MTNLSCLIDCLAFDSIKSGDFICVSVCDCFIFKSMDMWRTWQFLYSKKIFLKNASMLDLRCTIKSSFAVFLQSLIDKNFLFRQYCFKYWNNRSHFEKYCPCFIWPKLATAIVLDNLLIGALNHYSLSSFNFLKVVSG